MLAMRPRLLAEFLATPILLVQIGACSDRSPISTPTAEDLAGSYELSEPSAKFLRENKHYKTLPVSQVRLNMDQTVAVASIPDAYIDGFGRGLGSFVSGDGRWEVNAFNGHYGLTLTINQGSSMPAGIYHGSSILIVGREPPYQLELQLGDPDSRETLLYQRRN